MYLQFFPPYFHEGANITTFQLKGCTHAHTHTHPHEEHLRVEFDDYVEGERRSKTV